MAWYDDWDSGGDYFDNQQDFDVNDLLFGNTQEMDPHAQDLFVEAFFNDNQEAYVELVDYMWDQYQIDFEDAFEWADFREWYNSQ